MQIECIVGPISGSIQPVLEPGDRAAQGRREGAQAKPEELRGPIGGVARHPGTFATSNPPDSDSAGSGTKEDQPRAAGRSRPDPPGPQRSAIGLEKDRQWQLGKS